MKKLKFFLYTITTLLVITACDDIENYDAYENYALSTGTVIFEDNSFHIITDDGFKFFQKDDINDVEDGMRVLFKYTIVEEIEGGETNDYYVVIKNIKEILTKPIFNFTNETTTEITDSIGETPIHIVETWFTDNYLNVHFEYYGNYKVHYVNLIHDISNPVTENGEIILELKHNDNGDMWSSVIWGVASFDISELKKENQNSVNLLIRSYDYNQDYEYNKVLTYKYEDGDNTQSAHIYSRYRNLLDKIYIK
ncbi:NigD1/NigD2 family lipoprotein [Plebeiibacterium marinum]|uniref:NigD-like C-terminal domain-containing protein n=1 Tax=Plebeiibacterium marinum TaxID=2992111 RepID=A0AAE3MEU1_9BACT|nr:NigD-like C-terminal domain-containing protein [Plebeiobacterium marinum]MCW3805757.1 hypothetical protein [Plebeiobacterium marinum]